MGITNSSKQISSHRMDCEGTIKVTLALSAAPDIRSHPRKLLRYLKAGLKNPLFDDALPGRQAEGRHQRRLEIRGKARIGGRADRKPSPAPSRTPEKQLPSLAFLPDAHLL